MTRKNIVLICLCVFSIWRVSLFSIAAVAPHILNYRPTFVYPELLPQFIKTSWIYSWANFDGVHYITIAKEGYKAADLIQAFFPVFPLFMRATSFVMSNELVAGLFISNVAFVLLLGTWYLYFRLFFSEKTVLLSLFILLTFPTSFFFAAVYGESLFLLFVLLSLFFAHKKIWWAASLTAFFAVGSRIVGVFVIPMLMLELFQQTHSNVNVSTLTLKKVLEFVKTEYKRILIISLSFLSLALYMLYLWLEFKDPFYFYSVQSKFGGGREQSVISYFQVLWRYLKILVTANIRTFSYYAAAQELVISLLTLGAIGLGLVKKYQIRLSWMFFSLCAYFLPTLTGTLSSMPRYVLVIFPIFLVAAQVFQKRKYLFIVYTIFSVALLIINTIMFIQGYWVA